MSAPRPHVRWRLEARLYDNDYVTEGDTPREACALMVEIDDVLHGPSDLGHVAYINQLDENTYHCASSTSPDFSNGWEIGTVRRIVTYYPDSDYPDDELPCPRVLVVTPAERRLLSDLPGAQQSRGISRQYLASERIEWAGLTQAQADRLAAWWAEALEEGGNWFIARRWPTPQGVPVNRRWKGPLSWRLLPSRPEARVWTVSGECEVRRAPPEAP